MTDQIQSGMMAMLQGMTMQNQVPQVGKNTGEVDFQQMLEQKSQNQPAKEEAKPQQAEKSQQTEEAPEQPTQQPEGQEDGHAMVKRLAEAGVIPVDVASAYLVQSQQPVQQPEQTLEVAPLELEGQPVLVTPEFQQQDQVEVIPQNVELPQLEEIQPEQVLQQVEPQQQPVQQNLVVEQAPEREILPEQQEITVQQAEPQQGEQEDGTEQVDFSQSAQPLFHNVEAAPIKVGEAYQPEETTDVNQQIAGPLNQALAQGQNKVEIHLNPEYLGSVKVEIIQSAEGILRVALTAESSETRGLLEKHAANLQSLLSGRQQQTVEVEVQRQQNGQQPQDTPYEDGHNGQNKQQPRQRREQKGDGQDFLQKLRLGLNPVEVDR